MITPNGTSTQEFDTKLAGLWDGLAKAEADAARYMRAMHRAAGDKETGYGNQRAWAMRDAQVIEQFRALATADLPAGASGLVSYDSTEPRTYLTALRGFYRLVAVATGLEQQIATLDVIYQEAPWQRYFLCRANGGHIHASWRGCSTIRPDTMMAWCPELSGHGVAEAVKALGERLCTHCFPDAPAEWSNGELRETREAREARDAAKAERAAKQALKNLTPDQQFRDAMNDRVTTVAGCKEALRDEVRYRDYYGHGKHSFHPASVIAARRATEVLLAREAAVPGSGADQAAIDKIIANAVKQNRKDGARI